MCWLIMVGVRGLRVDPAAIFDAHGYIAEPSTNPACAHMGSNAVKLAISDGHCACGIFIGNGKHAPGDAERMRERYRRKGWSPGKIERAVEARLASDAGKEGRRAAANRFPETISALVKEGAEVSLLAHFFDGSFDEPFEIAARERISFADFMARNGAFPGDTLVTVAP